MALTDLDQVALARVLADSTLAARGNVLFGIVIGAAGASVLWENGELTLGLTPATILDKIVGVNADQRVVTFTDGTGGVNSPAYRGTIVRRYTRQLNGADTIVSFTLIRLLSNGQLMEVPSSAVDDEGIPQ
jgi:hypothetical protein